MIENSDKVKGISEKKIFNYNGRQMDFTIPRVMGIVNVTPDSFYEASRTSSPGPLSFRRGGIGGEVSQMQTVAQMIEEGAYIIDIGAVSTRPGAAEVDSSEEKKRLLPVLKKVRKEYPGIIISVDTYRSEIARIAAAEGADMINDISGGTFDAQMIETVIDLKIPYVIMHIRGTPANMQVNPVYQDVVEEVFSFLSGLAKFLEEAGHHKIILDPGFGFGKTVDHNYTLLNNLFRLTANGFPVLAGLSRKSMINRVLGTKPEDALNGTTVLNTVALLKGASILRVHDVKEATEAVKLVASLI